MKTQEHVIAWAKEEVSSSHGNLDARWEDIARYFRPQSLGYNTERTEGSELEEAVYDSLPIDQADRMARNLFAWILNPAIRWFTFEWDDDELKENSEAKTWLEDSVKKLEKKLKDSNWSMKALQAIFDLVTPGTAMMQVDEKPSLYDEDDGEFRGLLFKTHHMSVSFGAEGADDFVHNTVVVYKFTSLQAAELYGEDNLPQKVKDDLAKGKCTEKFKFIHAIVRRRLERPPENDVLLPANKRPYWSLHFEQESGQVVKDDGFYELTRTMPRYSTTNDSVYGYSPAMKALPDARVLNEAQQKDLDAWDKALEPPVKVDPDKLKTGEIHQEARGVTEVDDMDAIGEMPGKPDYQAHILNTEDKRASIRRIFLSDELDIPDRERVGQMTAFEIQKRVERILRSAGSVVTSIHTELLQPMLFASFMMLLRRDVFDDVPKSVAEKGGEDVLKVTFLGPLAKAQRAEDSEVIRAAVSDLVNLASTLPDPIERAELMDIVDLDEAVRLSYTSMGVPQKIIRSEDEVKRRREDRRERIQEAGAAGAEDPAGQGPVGRAA